MGSSDHCSLMATMNVATAGISTIVLYNLTQAGLIANYQYCWCWWSFNSLRLVRVWKILHVDIAYGSNITFIKQTGWKLWRCLMWCDWLLVSVSSQRSDSGFQSCRPALLFFQHRYSSSTRSSASPSFVMYYFMALSCSSVFLLNHQCFDFKSRKILLQFGSADVGKDSAPGYPCASGFALPHGM